MKKTLFTLMLLGLFSLSYGQIEKGHIQLGGTINFFSSDSDGAKRSNLNFAPRAGLFLSNTTALGLQLGIGSSSQDVLDTQSSNIVEQTSNSFQVGVYARFHKPVVDNLYLLLQPSASFSSGKNEVDGTERGTSNGFNLQVALGLTYFLSPKFAVDMTLGVLSYSNNSNEVAGNEFNTDVFNLNLNLQNVGFGLSYFIR